MKKISFLAILLIALTAHMGFASVSESQHLELDAESAQALIDSLLQAQNQKDNKIVSKLQPKSGLITLSKAKAILDIPEGFVFLDLKDTKVILEQLWGNPPSETPFEGMIMTSKYDFSDGRSWGAVIEFVDEGYVSDEDAKDMDYSELLEEMKEANEENNKQIAEMGYEPAYLEGWAVSPEYNEAEHKLSWAKVYRIGEGENKSLNYDVRMLSRRGFLQMTFVSSLTQLEEIKEEMPKVLAMAKFQEGETYDDFDESTDKIAAYGIGALVAGKLASKIGFFAKFLLVFKKLWIVVLAGGYALFKKFTGRKEEEDVFLSEESENENLEENSEDESREV